MQWFKAWLTRRPAASPERQRALDLIAAIDAGGLPLNPARVNDIARKLGLEVSTKARIDDTIVRIRAALQRDPP
ncbi:conserved hypothetical protein [Leptothrix cholodnii SP-6]|uniref:Uncharacterized protein n=1 Tax=Leptothrix cholodnii (strain ATCC 51168 / LMG 8142 / SP-6) TaxID=395495 RepID=B1XY94_LEPCP|nr:hypothetical protein [Leptothrix cholodnii]ACB33995.1 conserved hypothetical protein [Leptothrix cholodnii SP-6]